MNFYKNVKNKYFAMGILFLILFGNLLLLNSLNNIFFEYNIRKSQSPKLSNEDITIITPENRTYTNSSCDYYIANYGFDYDAHGAKPTGWDVFPNPSTLVRVIDELGGHKKVVEFQDYSNSYGATMETTFNETEEGVIEYWVRGYNVNWRFFLEVFQNDTMILRIRIRQNNIDYYDGSYHTARDINRNTWYHVKVKIFTSNDSGELYVNGILAHRGGLIGTPSGFNKVRFNTDDSEIGYPDHPICYYVDAVGFSWNSSYTIGDNLKEGILFNYETDKDLNWTGYSLDGQANITIHDNYLIPMLEDGLHTIQVFANDSSGTVYQSAIRYFTLDPLSINSPENRTYTNYAAITSGYYRATYGFENDAYKGNPIGWTILEYPEIEGPTFVDIIDEVDGHKNVVKFFDLSPSIFGNRVAAMGTTFSETEEGVIEFWARGCDVTYKFAFEIYQDYAMILRIRFYNGYIQYYDGSYTNVMSVNDNTWYHIKVNISVTSDSADLYINGTYAHHSGGLIGTPSYMNRISFHTDADEYLALYYVDAVGFSWDPNYNVGDNFVSKWDGTGWLLDVEESFEHDWMGYSIDGQSSITILGDSVIPVPEEGHHTIQVFANDSSGTVYESDIVHFHVYWDATVPDPPMNLKLDQEIGHIYLDWKKAADNNAPIIRYNVYRGNITGGEKELINSTKNTYYDDIDAGNYIGHRFYYIIRAENILGESDDSEEVSGKAYDVPFIEWQSPEENARVVFPYKASNPGEDSSLFVIFNFTYDPGGLDYFNLKLNEYNEYENVSNSVTLYYDDEINGYVNATLFGFIEGESEPVVQSSRNFTFALIMKEEFKIYDEGMNNTGLQLYLILHDPHGDHSFSGFSETTSFSKGVRTYVSNVETLKVGASFNLFGADLGASTRIEYKEAEEYDFRFEQTETLSFTSNQASEDPDYIGPGRGDIYWGEVWIVNWVLKAYNRSYYGETEWVSEDPILLYGINRTAEALLNDNYAPENWKALNPVHNDWSGVEWFPQPMSIPGGVPRTLSCYTKTTESWGFYTELKIDDSVSAGLWGVSTSLKLHFEETNYNYYNETKEYEVSYTIHDDEPTDFIIQDVGIDKRFGTYIFRPYSLACNTSNPLEHDTFDYIPPLIEFPDIDLDSNDDNHFPCPDDSPIVTVDIFDEGGIQLAKIRYSVNDGADWEEIVLIEQVTSPGTWEGVIPAQESNTRVLWYIYALDLEGHASVRKDTLGNPFEYTVIKKPKGPEAITAYPYSFTILIMISTMVLIIITIHKKRYKNE